MATVGSGIVPDRRDDVREIWNLLAEAKPFLDKAFDELIATEKKTMAITGNTQSSIINNDRVEWKDACNFVPAQFSKSLNDA